MLTRVFSGLLDLLAPRSCVSCTSYLNEQERAFCPACEPLLEPLIDEATSSYRALYRYGGPVAEAIQRLKYQGCSEVARALSMDLANAVIDLRGRVDAVTAIPLSRAKLRTRGYNQSGLLARCVARSLMVPCRPRWLHRTHEMGRQVGQSRATRVAQTRDAFAAQPAVRGKRVLLVDDVRTTGATLLAATDALLRGGAHDVYQLVLAEADDRSEGASLYSVS
jgi:ComF family protein